VKLSKIHWTGIGVGLVCVALLAAAPEKHDPAAALKRQCGDDVGAYIAAKEFVGRRLKNPADASYASMVGDSGYSSVLRDCKWTIKAYVDATNSYGATIRTPFVVTVWYLPNEDSWQTSGVNIVE
jgi:hypothetical protein